MKPRPNSTIRRFPLVLAVATAFAAAMVPLVAPGQDGGSPLLPPNATFRGKSYDEWNLLNTQRTVATGLGGQVLPDTVQGVRLLPGEFAPGKFEFHIEVDAGTALVFPSFFVFGELYDDGTFDDPVALAELVELIFATTTIETRVDGEVVLSGSGSELGDFLYGPTFFDEPIPYEEPQPRGPGLNAVAALWGTGIGSVYRPLPVGEHTLVSIVDSAFFGQFEYTYHITVRPPAP